MVEFLLILGTLGMCLNTIGQLWEFYKQLKEMERQIDLRLEALKAAQEFQEDILKELTSIAEKRRSGERLD
jgi:cytochrome c biogenesis protein ResB